MLMCMLHAARAGAAPASGTTLLDVITFGSGELAACIMRLLDSSGQQALFQTCSAVYASPAVNQCISSLGLCGKVQHRKAEVLWPKHACSAQQVKLLCGAQR